MSETVGYTLAASVELILQINPHEYQDRVGGIINDLCRTYYFYVKQILILYFHALFLNINRSRWFLFDYFLLAKGPLGGRTGALIPTTPNIYEPILARLKDVGLIWIESVTVKVPDDNKQ
jgi:hypothetical protein